MKDRITQVLDGFLRHTATARAARVDSDRITGGERAHPPPGVRLDGGADSPPPPRDVSPYHYYRWRFDHATDELETMRLVHAAEKYLHKLDNPERHDTPNYENLEERICVWGRGLTNEEIAEHEGIPVAHVWEIRKSNDLDDLGAQVATKEFLVELARRRSVDDGWTIPQIAAYVSRSERTVRRWLTGEMVA